MPKMFVLKINIWQVVRLQYTFRINKKYSDIENNQNTFKTL